MTKFFIIILTLAFSSNSSFGQSNWIFPTLGQFQNFLTISSNDKFKPSAKQLGFTFESKATETYGIDYVYVRRTKVGDLTYTDKLVYTINTNRLLPIIALTSIKDLEDLYLPTINKTFSIVECQGETQSNELQSCFDNKTYFIRLIDVSKSFSDGTKGNSYTLRMYIK